MIKGKEVIHNNQFRDLLICIMWPSTINYASGILARKVGHDMWISGIIGILTVLPFLFLVIYVGQKFSDKTIVEYSSELLGKLLGKILGLILTLYFFLNASSSISMYIQHLTGFLLPKTPFLVVAALHIFVISFIVWKGPEVIARTAVFAFGFSIIFFILVFMASLAEINIDRITPFFDFGVMPVLKSSIETDTFIGLTPLLVAMILPMVSNPQKAFGSAASGLFIGGFFFIFYFVAELMVMGPQVVAIMRIPSMDFVRSIQITQYLHRFESFMVALWYWSIMIQAGIYSYCSYKAFMQTTGIKKKSPYIIGIFGLAIIVLTYFIGKNDVWFLYLREHVWKYFAVPIDFGIPLILFLALGFKKLSQKAN
ncbi:endospore germination permease [Desulfitobacterium sp. Sab5]|uniref:GerAB/ArcD/ProY family transporter n=1 Tax=Desulfitobacterium nosdiversum TaxID=3375356 RepID=UPI003CE7A285